MRFWDSSAIVPLLLSEDYSSAVRTAFAEDAHQVVWWATQVECTSAVCRRERDGSLNAAGSQRALTTLQRLQASWDTVEPSSAIRSTAVRLLRTHSLRAADALQLAAAIAVADGDPASLRLVTLDQRLAEAAGREGLVAELPT